jgi:hypothetical protein
MVNRIEKLLDYEEEPLPPGDYFVVHAGGYVRYYVTRETAECVARVIARRWPPRWVRFTDVFGSDIRLLCRLIQSVYESSEAQRRRERDFERARDREDREGRLPWEDD